MPRLRIHARSGALATIALSGLASTAQAAFIGLTSTNAQVVDGSRRFSVIDVYAEFTGAYDKLVNFYGSTGSTSMVRSSLNGVADAIGFAQAGGSNWLPSGSSSGSAWDSYVTIGARSQSDASSLVQADPYFLNASTVGAGTVSGGSNSQGTYVGAGWFTGSPTASHVFAGTYVDRRIMLGRFSVETTGLSATDVVTLRYKGNLSMRVNGASAGAGSIL
ncbi:MAG: hypothetical protein ACKPEA_03950, partial [Planctomycetota bacterium]